MNVIILATLGALGLGLVVFGAIVLVVLVVKRRPRSGPTPEAHAPPSAPPSAERDPASEPRDLSHADPYLNWLVAKGGCVDGWTFHLGQRTLLVGRGPKCVIQVRDPEFSRVHCRVRPVPGGLHVEDTGSVNGIYVGGHRVGEAELADGASFSIADVTFVYHHLANYRTDASLEGLGPDKWAGMLTAHRFVLEPVDEEGDGSASVPTADPKEQLLGLRPLPGLAPPSEDEEETGSWVGAEATVNEATELDGIVADFASNSEGGDPTDTMDMGAQEPTIDGDEPTLTADDADPTVTTTSQ